jgi:hypothetical protein
MRKKQARRKTPTNRKANKGDRMKTRKLEGMDIAAIVCGILLAALIIWFVCWSLLCR